MDMALEEIEGGRNSWGCTVQCSTTNSRLGPTMLMDDRRAHWWVEGARYLKKTDNSWATVLQVAVVLVVSSEYLRNAFLLYFSLYTQRIALTSRNCHRMDEKRS